MFFARVVCRAGVKSLFPYKLLFLVGFLTFSTVAVFRVVLTGVVVAQADPEVQQSTGVIPAVPQPVYCPHLGRLQQHRRAGEGTVRQILFPS